MNKSQIKTAFRDTIPVMTGYLVLGMGFGIVMKVNGFSSLVAILMSAAIYAGSMQYAGVGLLTGGASFVTTALTTLAINARHLFYGISMVDKYKNVGARKPYMIFALTDETYSLVCDGKHDRDYCFFVSLFDHIYWVSGTVFGCILGGAIRFDTTGIDFSLTALFITVFVDQWLSTRDHTPALIGVGLSAACLFLFGADSFLIPAMASIAAALLLRMRKEKKA